MNQGGKHAGETGRLENKRERRRGAAGRAAALRRAPSDSDCSGETASLSADSGDRAPRPAPLAPPRSGKTRSRRRGSEWEVLEGLKDGQRFEKRPDVFNGYLHKKRKWPLKGWHKRFFVIDGGILVYARSPTDVARGRLHGSVDVGLSVISAKARRRRIDIDADEFIYHLRAKTPEVFRTWLNVLKAHRLYRQHLLTFGARESVPKIHAPLEDLPATDTSSHTSLTSETSTETSIRVENPDSHSPPISDMPINVESSVYSQKDQNSICQWQQNLSNSSLIPLDFEPLTEKEFDLKLDDNLHNYKSMCSMHCMQRRCLEELKRRKSPDNSLNTTDAEKQITYTDLELKSLKNSQQLNAPILDDSTNSQKHNTQNSGPTNNPRASKEGNHNTYCNKVPEQKRSPFLNSKLPSTTTCFFFTRKKHEVNTVAIMRKSKKCTNLVKYKNLCDEPPLKMQSSKCMLLGKYKLTTKPVHSERTRRTHKTVACEPACKEIKNNEVQVKMDSNSSNKNKASITTTADYDEITEKLMVSIFQKNDDGEKDVKYYINQVIKDLYDVKVDQGMHPVKALFRNLLEYWLKNTSITPFREAMTSNKSVDRQSNKHFTKDENLSSFVLKTKCKETQFHGLSDVMAQYKVDKNANTVRQKGKDTKCEVKIPPKCPSPRRDTESYEKERRVQELERLLRSTVYVCETVRNNTNKDKDIKITKKLINHLGKLSKYNDLSTSDERPSMEKSSSSAEIPKMQETINHLISETCIPPDVAKEFFGAYLDVLLQDSNSKSTTTSQSSEWEKQSQENTACDVVAESVVKKLSKSITTLDEVVNKNRKDNLPTQNDNITNIDEIDPGQVYLRDILDKVTTIFSKVKKVENGDFWQHEKPKENPKTIDSKVQKTVKDELGRPVFKHSEKNLVYENCDENSIVIDLCRYDLEHISMFNDPDLKGIMSITIKLKEKPPNHGESKQTHLSLKFADDAKPILTNIKKPNDWMPYLKPDDSTSNEVFDKLPLETNKITCLGFEASRNITNLKPFLSNSDGTSNAERPLNASYHSIDEPNTTTRTKDTVARNLQNDDPQSCYIMSFRTSALASKLMPKKKTVSRECDCESAVIRPKEYTAPSTSSAANKPGTDPIAFDKSPPKIIDEKFILILLENLTFLSRNVPSLHKEINTLYVKLKKKHDKTTKNSNNGQGLSLLGKIYSEDQCSKDGDDRGTQFDPNVNEDTNNTQNVIRDASTNTNIYKFEEKAVCTYTQVHKFIHSKVQTLEPIEKKCIKQHAKKLIDNSREPIRSGAITEVSIISTGKCNRDCMIVAETETIDIDSADQGTSNRDSGKIITKECAMTTCIEYVLDSGASNSPATQTRYKLEKEKKKRNSLTMRQQLINEISLLSCSIKVSAQSQTDTLLLRCGMEKRLDKDYDVYRLYLSKKNSVKPSSSMTIPSSVHVETSDDLKTLYRCSSDPSYCSGLLSPTTPTIRGPQAGFVSGTPGGRLAGWIIESGGPLETASKELGQAQLSVQQLQRLLDALELQHQVHHDTDVSLEGASPNVKKDRRKFGLRKKKSNSKCASVDLAPPHIDPSSSHTALSSLSALTAPPSPGGGASSMPNSAASLPIACAAARPQSLPGAESLNAVPGPASLTSLTPDHQLREDFTVLAKDLVTSLKSIVSGLVCERGRLRAALEAAESSASPGGGVVSALRTNLTSALQQNSELRTRLSRIHDASDIAEIMSIANSDGVNRQFQQSLSYSSSCVSASEFFDAEEHEDDDDKQEEVMPTDEAGVIELDGDSSSEAGSLSSEEGSASSDNSDGAMLSAEQVTLRHTTNGTSSRGSCWTRRTRLPAPRPSPGGPSLWNLLYKNIGKDLSQISMPVTINEPLNMLQRLSEELEYSELLDSAAECQSSVERMCLIAAFAVSAYAASAHRAASKPFNPLLHETYECVRADRGFRFLAEQVSHHPPISACHAESPRWCFWQEARIKTKFWGKSMEFQPTGRVHVRLNTTGDHYTWNKVTTCVHNLFGGQRWVDQYGDMHIVCVGTDISCKLNFIKASSWSQSRHEVRGAVTGAGGARVRVQGRWSEALYAGEPPAAKCLWRPGAMPPENEIYYGFTRFAMELNEMEPGMRELLPHTDTRFRPDQRALEEGDVDAAEAFKHELEQAQRDRRRESPTRSAAWFRKTIEDGEETWVFSGEYWKAREAGFSDDVAPRIW